VNAEQVIASRPDLVLMASYTDQNVVNQIEQAHIPAYEFNDFNSIGDIERNIEVVGQLVGNPTTARRLVQSMKNQIQRVKNAVKNQKKLRVLDYSSYGYVAGRSTTVNDVIVDAGGINAAASLNGWQKVTDEEIVKLNPDVIIDADDDSSFINKILSDPALKTVAAVKHRRVYAVKGADLSSVSQYVTKGVQDVAKLLYPKAFKK
jgi:iron complex transport system substrate-binding protein